jgi:hypothetical protein
MENWLRYTRVYRQVHPIRGWVGGIFFKKPSEFEKSRGILLTKSAWNRGVSMRKDIKRHIFGTKLFGFPSE